MRLYGSTLYRTALNLTGHPEDAEEVRQMILQRFPRVQEVRVYDIGTIISAHCGPGTVAVFFGGEGPRPD